jgi:hypothetical protein
LLGVAGRLTVGMFRFGDFAFQGINTSRDPAPMISRAKSDALVAEALNFIPGGVNSPVRAFRAVGGKPFFVNRASGCRVWDVDGNEYIDYVGTWGRSTSLAVVYSPRRAARLHLAR